MKKDLIRILNGCPTYHCKTRQLRPDKIFIIEDEAISITVCFVCFNKWNQIIEQRLKSKIKLTTQNPKIQTHFGLVA